MSAPTRGSARDRRGVVRLLAVVAVVGWLGILAVGVAYGALVEDLGDAYCEPFEGSSQYGELRWSVLPPGPTCTFTVAEHGFDEVRGPWPVMSVWIAVLVVGGLVCVALVRAARSPASTND
ncbi:MAG: hypothetical protein ACOYOQ_08890 [Microthrixaceae bacterium]